MPLAGQWLGDPSPTAELTNLRYPANAKARDNGKERAYRLAVLDRADQKARIQPLQEEPLLRCLALADGNVSGKFSRAFRPLAFGEFRLGGELSCAVTSVTLPAVVWIFPKRWRASVLAAVHSLMFMP